MASGRRGFEKVEAFADAIQKRDLFFDETNGPLGTRKRLLVYIGEEGSDQVEIYKAPKGSTLWHLLTSKNPNMDWDPRKEVLWVAVWKTQTKSRSVLILMRPPVTDPSKGTSEVPPVNGWHRVMEVWNLSENL